jgi:hypothetical protein
MSPSSTIARAAIAFIMTMALANDASAAAASCRQAARHLVTLVKSSSPSSDPTNAGATGDMIELIMRKSPAGVVVGTPRAKLTYSREKFTALAERLKPPFTPSSELLTALDDLDQEIVVIALPGTNMLAASSIGGTAHCNSTVFFSTARRRGSMVEGPESWKNDGGASCGVTRSFASIDRMPFVIDDTLDFGPSLISTLTLTPWIDGKWAEPCQADFVFAPHFDTKNLRNDWARLNDWARNDCGTDCAGFQRAATELVRQAQLDPAGAEARLLAAMTSPQREEYLRLKRIADRPDVLDLPAGGDDAKRRAAAAALTDKSPLVLPMVVDGRVFLATVGHFTIGWRVFSDWKVSVETGEADHTREIARFAIGMTQGPIISATVK